MEEASRGRDARKRGWLNFLVFDIAGGDQLKLDLASKQPVWTSMLVKWLKQVRENERIEALKKFQR